MESNEPQIGAYDASPVHKGVVTNHMMHLLKDQALILGAESALLKETNLTTIGRVLNMRESMRDLLRGTIVRFCPKEPEPLDELGRLSAEINQAFDLIEKKMSGLPEDAALNVCRTCITSTRHECHNAIGYAQSLLEGKAASDPRYDVLPKYRPSISKANVVEELQKMHQIISSQSRRPYKSKDFRRHVASVVDSFKTIGIAAIQHCPNTITSPEDIANFKEQFHKAFGMAGKDLKEWPMTLFWNEFANLVARIHVTLTPRIRAQSSKIETPANDMATQMETPDPASLEAHAVAKAEQDKEPDLTLINAKPSNSENKSPDESEHRKPMENLATNIGFSATEAAPPIDDRQNDASVDQPDSTIDAPTKETPIIRAPRSPRFRAALEEAEQKTVLVLQRIIRKARQAATHCGLLRAVPITSNNSEEIVGLEQKLDWVLAALTKLTSPKEDAAS
jgi:hypothetical protein